MRRTAIGMAAAMLPFVLSGCIQVSADAAPSGSPAACAGADAFRDEVRDISLRIQTGVTMDQYMEMVGVAFTHRYRLGEGCLDAATEEAFSAYALASMSWGLCVPDGCTITRADLDLQWARAARALRSSPAPR
jgi:hypothetical protein